MLSTLIKKEIHNNVLSFRFLVTFLLLLVIVPVTVLILTNDYVRKTDEYSQRQAAIQNYLSRYAHFNRLYAVIGPSQPPIAFYSLVRGLSADVNMDAFDNDPLPVMFPLIDLTLIVAVLLSLAALVFSYDSVCGEKEDGTLKLALSNSISRAQILAGKALGGVLTLLIPFLISLIIGLVLLLLNPRVVWRGSDWGALGMILAGAVLYLLVFYSLGVFISSRHLSSSSSIMTSLFVWVLVVLVIPNLSPYAASIFRPSPSRIKIGREVERLSNVERDNLGRQLSKERTAEVVKQYPVLAPALKMPERELKEKIKNDPEFAKAYVVLKDVIEKAWRDANVIQEAKTQRLTDDLKIREEAQTRLSTVISMISPLADFTYLASELSNTGMRNQKHFEVLSKAWSKLYGEYMRRKMEDLSKKDPTMDVWNTPVDVSDMPRFEYREEALSGRIAVTLRYFTVLMAANVLFFVAAFMSFVKYDVR